MWWNNQLFLCRPSYLTIYVCSPNHYDLEAQFIKMSLIYFNFHKDFIKFQSLEHEIFCFAKIKSILHALYVNIKH